MPRIDPGRKPTSQDKLREWELLKLREENARLKQVEDDYNHLLSMTEATWKTSLTDPHDNVIFVNIKGDVTGIFVPNEGWFPSIEVTLQFSKLTNELTALITGVLVTTMQGSGPWREEYLRKQEGEIGAAYKRLRTFIQSIGDDPDSTPAYRNARQAVKEVERGISQALQTGDYSLLEQLTRNANECISDVFRELANVPKRQRDRAEQTVWLAQNTVMIRDAYIRKTGRPQHYVDTAQALLQKLKEVNEEWATDVRLMIEQYTQATPPNIEGLRRYLDKIVRRNKNSKTPPVS